MNKTHETFPTDSDVKLLGSVAVFALGVMLLGDVLIFAVLIAAIASVT